ncbi:hypothetical protein HI113_42810 [Corallococcus exiguus]|nr:hypothetical protein [Corallococcus exiguus]
MSSPSAPSAESTPSTEAVRWRMASADNTLSRLQRLAVDLRGCDVVAYPVVGPDFAGLALATRDGSGRTATLGFDDAVRARQERRPGGLARAARAALGLPASADRSESSQLDRKVGDFHVAVTADISSAASELKALDAQLQQTAASMAQVASGPVTPSALAALIASASSALATLHAANIAGNVVGSAVVEQVAGDVAALVARARAVACPA